MKNAVAIFGATSKIGASVVSRFLAHDFVVHAIGRNAQKLDVVGQQLSEHRSPIIYHTCDVLDDKSIQNTSQSIKKYCLVLKHQLASVVYCVGVRKDQLLARSPDDDLKLTLDTNLLGALRVCKHMSKLLIGKHQSSIVLVGSVVGETGNIGQTAYSSSKSGLHGLTRSLAVELKSKNVNINLVSPGYVDTDFISDLNLDALKQHVPLGRIAGPDEVAASVYFLATCSGISGQNLFVDGGLNLAGIP